MKYKTVLSLLLAALLTGAVLPASAYDSAAPGSVRTMSGGDLESFVIDGTGTLWAWGGNQWGQLGDGTSEERTAPVKVLEGVRSVSAGDSHTYAVLEDNTLWAWGRNVSNAFPGMDGLVSSPAPIKIMDDVASASTGVCTHLAVKTDGSLWAWGKYTGSKTDKQISAPQKIMDNVAAACTGYSHSLALKKDGSLWAWGQNIYGESGSNAGIKVLTPAKVLDGVASMSAGYGFSAAVKTDGTLWTWGRNSQGELGDGTLWSWDITWSWNSPDPEEDAILQDTLACWNETWGSHVSRDHSVPYQILDEVVSVHASNNNAFALREDGTLWAWGNNRYGNIGDGTAEDRLFPTPVLDNVAQIAAGWDHVLALRTDDTLWSWGGNISGQLGNGEHLFYGSYSPRFSAHPIPVMKHLSGQASVTSQPAGTAPAQWAKAAVDSAIANEFLPVPLRTGYNQTITRAEFCTLAVQFYEQFTCTEITGRTKFSDTDNPAVEKAAYLGIVSGVSSGRFAPNSPLNREQAALILTNLAQALGAPLPQSPAGFADNSSIGGWALDAVGRVQGAGIMSGVGGGRFAPQDTYTREQSAATIMNLYEILLRP